MAAGPTLIYVGVITVGVAYTLQVIAQVQANPVHAGIILSLEAVFGALGGYLILDEWLSARQLTGCGLMLLGMICLSWPAPSLRLNRLQTGRACLVLRQKNTGWAVWVCRQGVFGMLILRRVIPLPALVSGQHAGIIG